MQTAMSLNASAVGSQMLRCRLAGVLGSLGSVLRKSMYQLLIHSREWA